MTALVDLPELDLAAFCSTTALGETVLLSDVDLGEQFVPRRTELVLCRLGNGTGVLVPKDVEFHGTDIRLKGTQVIQGWRLLHVGPAEMKVCLREFVSLCAVATPRPAADNGVRKNEMVR